MRDWVTVLEGCGKGIKEGIKEDKMITRGKWDWGRVRGGKERGNCRDRFTKKGVSSESKATAGTFKFFQGFCFLFVFFFCFFLDPSSNLLAGTSRIGR